MRFARRHGIPFSVRGGGHHWAGAALCPDGLVIDISRMKQVVVDPHSRVATVAGGAKAMDVAAAAGAHGLVAALGNCGEVGMAGFALGGGYGPLNGLYGLAADNLLSAEVVLADGRRVTTGPDEEPERRFHNLISWNEMGRGGHYPGWEQPDLLVAELRSAFRHARGSSDGKGLRSISERFQGK